MTEVPHCCGLVLSTWCRGRQRAQSPRQCWFYDVDDKQRKYNANIDTSNTGTNTEENTVDLIIMMSLRLVKKPMEIPVNRNPSWSKKGKWGSGRFQAVRGKMKLTALGAVHCSMKESRIYFEFPLPSGPMFPPSGIFLQVMHFRPYTLYISKISDPNKNWEQKLSEHTLVSGHLRWYQMTLFVPEVMPGRRPNSPSC